MDAWSPTRLWNVSIGGVACFLFMVVGLGFLRGGAPDGAEEGAFLLAFAAAFVLVVKFTLGTLVGTPSSTWEMVLLVAAGAVLGYAFAYANEAGLGLAAAASYAVAIVGVRALSKPRSRGPTPASV